MSSVTCAGQSCQCDWRFCVKSPGRDLLLRRCGHLSHKNTQTTTPSPFCKVQSTQHKTKMLLSSNSFISCSSLLAVGSRSMKALPALVAMAMIMLKSAMAQNAEMVLCEDNGGVKIAYKGKINSAPISFRIE